MPSGIVSPSLLSGDFARLADECKRMISLGADYLHMDIMDGHFVPNLTMGAPVIGSVRNHLPEAFLDCHLMVTEPEKWISDFAKAGASMFTFHLEAVVPDWSSKTGEADDFLSPTSIQIVQRISEKIKSNGMKVGLSIRPKTPVAKVFPLIKFLDMVLIMTVEPGFGGQSFQPECLEKVKMLRKFAPFLDIEVDGGLAPENIDLAAASGANVIVAGSSIFKAKDPGQVINLFHESLQKHGFPRLAQ